jgi:hypothetical protein
VKKTFVIAAVLMAAVLTAILSMTTTAYADVGDAPIDAEDISNTDIESRGHQCLIFPRLCLFFFLSL